MHPERRKISERSRERVPVDRLTFIKVLAFFYIVLFKSVAQKKKKCKFVFTKLHFLDNSVQKGHQMLGKKVTEFDFAQRIVVGNVGGVFGLFGAFKPGGDGVHQHVEMGRVRYLFFAPIDRFVIDPKDIRTLYTRCYRSYLAG